MTKAHHAGQKPTTIWMPEQLAEQLDRKLADAAQPGLRPSRSGFILHAIQRALQSPAEAAPVPSPAQPQDAPTAQPGANPAPSVEPAQPAQDDLQVALRRLFQARKICAGRGDDAELLFRDQTAAELAESAVMADVMYANLLDFARAGAAGLTEAPFCYIADGWADDEGMIVKDRSRPLSPLFSALDDIATAFRGGMFDGLPGPLAVRMEAHAKAQAKVQEKANKEAQRAARRAARSAKAPPTSAPAQQTEPPVAQASAPPSLSAPPSPFGQGPSEVLP